MTRLEQIESAAEACIAGFEQSLITMLATISTMRELGVSAPEIADRITAASKEMVLRAALMGRGVP